MSQEKKDRRFAVLNLLIKLLQPLSKTALHKSAYIIQQGYKVPLGYQFKDVDGPRSEQIDTDLAHLRSLGYLNPQRTQRGMDLTPLTTGPDAPQDIPIPQEWKAALARYVTSFGKKPDSDINLAANTLLIHHAAANSNREATIKGIGKINAKLRRQRLLQQYEELEQLGLL